MITLVPQKGKTRARLRFPSRRSRPIIANLASEKLKPRFTSQILTTPLLMVPSFRLLQSVSSPRRSAARYGEVQFILSSQAQAAERMRTDRSRS